jgi:hypothetical protein
MKLNRVYAEKIGPDFNIRTHANRVIIDYVYPGADDDYAVVPTSDITPLPDLYPHENTNKAVSNLYALSLAAEQMMEDLEKIEEDVSLQTRENKLYAFDVEERACSLFIDIIHALHIIDWEAYFPGDDTLNYYKHFFSQNTANNFIKHMDTIKCFFKAFNRKWLTAIHTPTQNCTKSTGFAIHALAELYPKILPHAAIYLPFCPNYAERGYFFKEKALFSFVERWQFYSQDVDHDRRLIIWRKGKTPIISIKTFKAGSHLLIGDYSLIGKLKKNPILFSPKRADHRLQCSNYITSLHTQLLFDKAEDIHRQMHKINRLLLGKNLTIEQIKIILEELNKLSNDHIFKCLYLPQIYTLILNTLDTSVRVGLSFASFNRSSNLMTKTQHIYFSIVWFFIFHDYFFKKTHKSIEDIQDIEYINGIEQNTTAEDFINYVNLEHNIEQKTKIISNLNIYFYIYLLQTHLIQKQDNEALYIYKNIIIIQNECMRQLYLSRLSYKKILNTIFNNKNICKKRTRSNTLDPGMESKTYCLKIIDILEQIAKYPPTHEQEGSCDSDSYLSVAQSLIQYWKFIYEQLNFSSR